MKLSERDLKLMRRPMPHKVEVRGLYHLTECVVATYPDEFKDDDCTCRAWHD